MSLVCDGSIMLELFADELEGGIPIITYMIPKAN